MLLEVEGLVNACCMLWDPNSKADTVWMARPEPLQPPNDLAKSGKDRKEKGKQRRGQE